MVFNGISTLTKVAVLEVSVSLHFCDFMISLIQKEAVLCHMLCMHYKTKFLNSHGVGYRYVCIKMAHRLIWIYFVERSLQPFQTRNNYNKKNMLEDFWV